MIVSEPDLSAKADPACVLSCLAVCLLLLLRTERASRVSGGLRGCKPRGARGVCASRRAACRRLPRTAYQGLTRGVCRTALLLMIASWLGGCDAAGTVCSNEPTICDGTYSGKYLCAPLPRLPCATNERRAPEGVAQLGCQGWESGTGRGRRAASRRGGARHASAALRGSAMDAPPPLLLLWCPSRRYLDDEGLSGSMPSQLGLLTALTTL